MGRAFSSRVHWVGGGCSSPVLRHAGFPRFAVDVLLAILLPVCASADAASEWEGPILKALAAQHGIEVGAMGSVHPFNAATQMNETEEFSEPEYVTFAELHFDRITSGQNFLLFNVWTRPSDIDDPGTYVYLPDGLTFASTAANFSIHGAHMIWDAAVAPWMTTAQGFVSPDVETFMNHHIDNLVLLYPSIDRWVVVNEAVKNFPTSTTSHVPGNLRDTIWKQEIGDDYVFKAFLRATQAGLGNRIYNDYGIYDPDAPKTLAVLQLVTQLKVMDLIDGVGFQMHLSGLAGVPTVEEFTSNFEQFAAVGVEVHVTEFDVSHCNTELCRTVTAPQAAFNAAKACRVVAACKSFSFWGLRNDLSWLHPSHVAPGLGASSSFYPLPFDEQYDPTPLFNAVVQAWSPSSIPSIGPASLGILLALLGTSGFLGVRARTQAHSRD